MTDADNDRDQLREALASTLYESMNDYLRLWGDLTEEQRRPWLVHADALIPVVEAYAASLVRPFVAVADWCEQRAAEITRAATFHGEPDQLRADIAAALADAAVDPQTER